jgi:hypothetical protein
MYHEATAETEKQQKGRPPRGSHPFWCYNNRDFNALGAIYCQLAGDDIFDAAERRIAWHAGIHRGRRPLTAAPLVVDDPSCISHEHERARPHPLWLALSQQGPRAR